MVTSPKTDKQLKLWELQGAQLESQSHIGNHGKGYSESEISVSS